MQNKITMDHGSGGKMTRDLVTTIFQKHFSNEILNQMNDAAVIETTGGRIAMTTDSFVIKPIFFEGGDIGKLSICGTVNDLACMGAIPSALTAGFIIEEGFNVQDLEKIVISMTKTAKEAGVKIVAGDIKIVEKGNADGIYINTTGIGFIPEGINLGGENAKPGDVIIVNGTIGNHGASIITSREEYGFKNKVESDVAPLSGMINSLTEKEKGIHIVRDATRGGLATVLNEISEQSKCTIEIYEETIPIEEKTLGVSELLGFDPLYFANEGRVVIFVCAEKAEQVKESMKNHKYGKNTCVIGKVVDNSDKSMVLLKTAGSGTRILNMLSGEPLPRIC